mgnify:CR=1 FL=1
MRNPTNLDQKRDFYKMQGEVFEQFCTVCHFDVSMGCKDCAIVQFLEACETIMDIDNLSQEDLDYVQED